MYSAAAPLALTKAGVIVANMLESYLAAWALPPDPEGADHVEHQDCRSSSDAARLHLHSAVDTGASALQSTEHRAPVQSSEPSKGAGLDSGADPNPRPGSRPNGTADDQTRRL